MEKQETEMKRKLETEMGTKNAPITGAMFSFSLPVPGLQEHKKETVIHCGASVIDVIPCTVH